jgi:hypothetical protein
MNASGLAEAVTDRLDWTGLDWTGLDQKTNFRTNAPYRRSLRAQIAPSAHLAENYFASGDMHDPNDPSRWFSQAFCGNANGQVAVKYQVTRDHVGARQR